MQTRRRSPPQLAWMLHGGPRLSFRPTGWRGRSGPRSRECPRRWSGEHPLDSPTRLPADSFCCPQQLLVPWVFVERRDAVSAVRFHHRRVVVHGEVDRDIRFLAFAEVSADEVRHLEQLGGRRRVPRPAAGLQVHRVALLLQNQERLSGAGAGDLLLRKQRVEHVEEDVHVGARPPSRVVSICWAEGADRSCSWSSRTNAAGSSRWFVPPGSRKKPFARLTVSAGRSSRVATTGG